MYISLLLHAVSKLILVKPVSIKLAKNNHDGEVQTLGRVSIGTFLGHLHFYTFFGKCKNHQDGVGRKQLVKYQLADSRSRCVNVDTGQSLLM